MQIESKTTNTPLAYTVEGAADALSIGRTSVYMLIKNGELPSFKMAGRRLVSRWAMENLARELEAKAQAQGESE